MTIAHLIRKIPDYAKDVKSNLDLIFIQDKHDLSKLQLYGVSLSVAYLLNNERLLNSIRAEAKMFLEEVDADACKTAAVVMSMMNSYHGFMKDIDNTDMSDKMFGLETEEFLNCSAKIEDFDIYCLSVSILLGCHYSCNTYTAKLRGRNITNDMINDICRIVSVLKATRDTLNIEGTRSYDFIVRGESMV